MKEMKFTSMDNFIEGKTYLNKNGDSITINTISNEENWKKVSFVINDSMQDIQNHENFLEMMNGKTHSLFDF